MNAYIQQMKELTNRELVDGLIGQNNVIQTFEKIAKEKATTPKTIVRATLSERKEIRGAMKAEILWRMENGHKDL